MNSEVYNLLLKKDCLSITNDLIGIHDYTIGSPAQVDFDWNYTLEREEQYGDVAGFLHTHPLVNDSSSRISCSSRDYDTMSAWVDCFGKPLYCLIGNGVNSGFTMHIFAPPKSMVVCHSKMFYTQELGDDGFYATEDYYKGCIVNTRKSCVNCDFLVLPGITIIGEWGKYHV